MSTNAQILDDLRYFADHAAEEKRASFLDSLKSYAAALISPVSIPFSLPAQKPALVLDGSGAGLVGILDFCDTLPATMTGDAWESAARHVLAMRQKS